MDLQNCYENLANAIIIQAVKDYRFVLKKLRLNPRDRTAALEKTSLERFFRSDDYRSFTSLGGEFLIRRLREEAKHDS